MAYLARQKNLRSMTDEALYWLYRESNDDVYQIRMEIDDRSNGRGLRAWVLEVERKLAFRLLEQYILNSPVDLAGNCIYCGEGWGREHDNSCMTRQAKRLVL